MKGDFSRVRFDPGKHYTRVLRQQGRVDLDADHNEESAILEHLQRTRDADVLGQAAAPHQNAGFEVSQGTGLVGDLSISKGHLYVDGLWCEADQDFRYLDQPSLLDPPKLEPVEGRTDLVYLDVWQRHVTALEDGTLREVALGGPDTTTRLQTVWQVKVVPGLAAGASCAGLTGWEPPESTARLTVGSTTVPLPDDPCLVTPGSGYRGVENHLYRVEVHKGGTRRTARFKWSRDNASMVFGIKRLMEDEPDRVYLNEFGKDRVSLLRIGDWVEILDKQTELAQESGVMAKIEFVDESQGYVRLDRNVPPGRFSITQAARLRRWDQVENVDENGLLKPSQTPLELEAGIVVTLTGDRFLVGDDWMFAARTGREGVQDLTTAAPHGTKHRYAKLALVTWETSDGSLEPKIQDCRRLFPALTELTGLFYVGGDGQEVMPDPRKPEALLPLPRKLEVGVGNGKWPVVGARVRFEIENPAKGVLAGVDQTGIALTNDNGVASVEWSLDSTNYTQHVVATLVDDAGSKHHLPVRFSANLSIASAVAYDAGDCPTMKDAVTVQEALDRARSLRRLYRVTGDGQEAMPWQELSPLVVQVADACGPVAEAKVTFAVESGGGKLKEADSTTDEEGLARCIWTVGGSGSQQVSATLTEEPEEGRLAEPTRLLFNASLSVASDVAYAATTSGSLGEAQTVQQAIDLLAQRVGAGTCTVTARPGEDLQAAVERLPESGGQLCLAAGVYELSDPLRVTRRSRVRIIGSGPATVLRGKHEVTLLVRDCSTVEVRALRVESGGMGTAPGEEHLMGAITFVRCTDVAVVDTQLVCRESRSGRGQACLAVHGQRGALPERTRVEHNRLAVGANQVGMLVVGARTIEIHDNHVVPGPGTKPLMSTLVKGRRSGLKSLGGADVVALIDDKEILERVGFQEGIVVAGAAEHVHIVGNTVEEAVQGVHVGSWANREGWIGAVVLERNHVISRVPSDYSSERHAIYVSNAESTTITDTRAQCYPPRVDKQAGEIDAIRLVGELGPFIRVVGVAVNGYTVGVRLAPLDDPGRAGLNDRMWYVGEVLAGGARSAADLSPAVHRGIIVTR